jgi:hypothetical protein
MTFIDRQHPAKLLPGSYPYRRSPPPDGRLGTWDRAGFLSLLPQMRPDHVQATRTLRASYSDCRPFMRCVEASKSEAGGVAIVTGVGGRAFPTLGGSYGAAGR